MLCISASDSLHSLSGLYILHEQKMKKKQIRKGKMMKKEMNREKEVHFFPVIRDAGRSRFKVHFVAMVDGRIRSCISKINRGPSFC